MTDDEKAELWKQLSPTMDLVLAVLTARHRLGDSLWTFDTGAQHAAITRLESMGLVTQMHGIVERTVRASLTDRGRDLVLLPGYVTSDQRRIAELEDLLGDVSLYIGWRYVTKQLTTEQKELFAGVRDQWSDRLRAEEGIDPPPTAEERAESDLHYRWWRR